MKRILIFDSHACTPWALQAQQAATYTLKSCLEARAAEQLLPAHCPHNEEQISKNNATLANAGLPAHLDLTGGYQGTWTIPRQQSPSHR